MKKILFVIFVLISFNSLAQLKVKEGSFEHRDAAVMDDKNEHFDSNDLPMALIKMSTENMPEVKRNALKIKSNPGVQLEITPKTGQIWIYITAENAQYINIKHPDEGQSYQYYFPEKLCGFCTYEMVLQYIQKKQSPSMLVVECYPQADVYIDGKLYGQTPYVENIYAGEHILTLKKEGYMDVTKTFVVNEGENLTFDEKLQEGKEVVIKTDEVGDKIYLDGVSVGYSPVKIMMSYGRHEFKAERDDSEVSETIYIAKNGDDEVLLELIKDITIVTGRENDIIYIDEEMVGVTPLKLKLPYGVHVIKVEQDNCFISKTINVSQNSESEIELKFVREIMVVTDRDGDEIYVDGNYVGTSPLSIELSLGSHEIEAKRNDKTSSKTINVMQTGGVVKVAFKFMENRTFTINGVSFTMVAVEDGTFQMGEITKAVRYYDVSEGHSVTLSDFYIGETEVTQALWKAVMNGNPSHYIGDDMPVDNVSWEDCKSFIYNLNRLTDVKFRLPTEAEWEYAARGGRKSQGYTYSGSDTVANVAWVSYNSDSRTHDVKTKDANEIGIYDMCGNVEEWCQDWYGHNVDEQQTNPTGPTTGTNRVLRGGSINRYAEVWNSLAGSPGYKDKYNGFRLAMDEGLCEQSFEIEFDTLSLQRLHKGFHCPKYLENCRMLIETKNNFDMNRYVESLSENLNSYSDEAERYPEYSFYASLVGTGNCGDFDLPGIGSKMTIFDKNNFKCIEIAEIGSDAIMHIAVWHDGELVCEADGAITLPNEGWWWPNEWEFGYGNYKLYDKNNDGKHYLKTEIMTEDCNSDSDCIYRKFTTEYYPTGEMYHKKIEEFVYCEDCIEGGYDSKIVEDKYYKEGCTDEDSACERQCFTVNRVPFVMIKVNGGTFKMGATPEQNGDAWKDEEPVHDVTLSDYYIGETEVTQELWEAVMGNNPSNYKGDKKPVENVSWDDCQNFIYKLNQLTGLDFRLPTEAEWEYAARGGNKSEGYKYSGSDKLEYVAWYPANSNSKIHDVKTKRPNELGIYDMSGNALEWCSDIYEIYYYNVSPQENPQGPSVSDKKRFGCSRSKDEIYRVVRGGGCRFHENYCRVSGRDKRHSYDLYEGYGIRLVLGSTLR